MSKERRLGRGLEALLGRPAEPAQGHQAQSPHTAELTDGTLTRDDAGQNWLDANSIDPNPFQPREDFDPAQLRSLQESIQEHGVLQPLLVRRAAGNRFELITGERRLRAAQAAGWQRVPVQIREADDRQMAELAIVENVQRKDLNPLEKATSFHNYLQQYGCTQEELAARIKIDRSTIANLIRLLELPQAVKEMLIAGKLTQGHARALLPLGEEAEQVHFAEKIFRESLNVRATEEAVQRKIRNADFEPLGLVAADGTRSAARRTIGPQLESLEQELRSALGTKVDLRQTSRGKGRIIIHFKNHQEFERLQALLQGTRPAADAA